MNTHAAPARRIRVAFCIDSMHVGGTEMNAVRTAERLDRSRIDLRVVCLRDEGPLRERYRAAGIPLHEFPIRNLYSPGTIRQGFRLARWLRANRIDVLHAHDVYTNAFGVLWARVAGVRTIASRRWWTGLPGRAWRMMDGLGYKLAHRVLANSEAVAEMLIREEGVGRSRVVTVRNFVDGDAFDEPPSGWKQALLGELGVPAGARVAGIVANLNPVKDHGTLLRAAAILAPRWPELHLVLVGKGRQRDALEALGRELGIAERVHFAGSRPNQPNLHHLFEISVLCSVREGLSNSILEAMAAGRPVVATRVGAAADAVVNGTTGLLLPPSDPAALAGALDALLANPERARRMGEAGRERARERYSAHMALSDLERLYGELAGPAELRGVERPVSEFAPAR